NMSNSKLNNFQKIYIIFLVLFYTVWTIAELVIRPSFSQIITDGSIIFQIVFDWILKNLCWTVPALILMKKFDEKLYINSKKLFTNPVNTKEVALVFLAEIAFCVLNSVISHKGFYFRAEGLQECISFIFVGVTEEFVFRAWLLNSSMTEKNKNSAIALNAVLFLCIHFPIWIFYGNFIAYMTSFSFIMIILLSIFFSWTMLYFKNIWVTVGVHMLWDILVTVLN
ncbi:MAG: CPBP family intramembrane metalloprotease, partial [Oscillospiraceae bacterium]|nr:CPBP family intramembrane metalloprotease [Oscillospiraceae bacterium]